MASASGTAQGRVLFRVAWVLLAISAIANAVKGSLWWDIWSLGLLVLIPAVVYGKMRRSRRISSDQDR